jgi:hypothetical protein
VLGLLRHEAALAALVLATLPRSALRVVASSAWWQSSWLVPRC